MGRLFFIGFFFCCLGLSAQAQVPDRTAVKLTLDLEELLSVWPRIADNDDQVVGSQGTIDRFHSRMVPLGETGTRFYVEEWRNDDPSQTYRQRIYDFGIDVEEGAIHIKVSYLRNAADVVGAYADPDKLALITEDQILHFDGCDFFIRKQGNNFFGGLKTDACVFPIDGEPRTFDYDLLITEDHLWFREKARRVSDDEVMVIENNFNWLEMNTARMFACMVDWPKDEGGPPNKTLHYIQLHDQGGQFIFEAPDGRTLAVGLRHTFGAGMERSTFWTGVHEGSVNGRLLAYGWGEPGADRIGTNPGWIRIQCDLDTPKNRQLQQDLRPDS